MNWFTPPFSVAVQGNLTYQFNNIIRRAFPQNHPYLNKLFNIRNLRLSYSTTPNLSSILSRHNAKIMRSFHENNQPPRVLCNCTRANKPNCPLRGQCLIDSVIYQAEAIVTGPVNETKLYIGESCNIFKQRYANHLKSFRHERYKNDTALSTYVWEKRELGAEVNIKWTILAKVPAYRPGDSHCRLCLAEKAAILKTSGDPRYLNKRGELFAKCRHRRRSLLSTVGKNN